MAQPGKNENISIKVSFGAGKPTQYMSGRPFSDLYLHFAHRQASSLITESDMDKFYRGVSVILFSALALEAGANEIIELGHLSENEKALHSNLKAGNKPKFSSQVTQKWYLLFQAKDSGKLPAEDATFKGIDSLFELRNKLAHFSMEKSATKVSLPLGQQVQGEDGMGNQVIASVPFTPGNLFEEISVTPPGIYYEWARNVFVKWGPTSPLSERVLKYAPPIDGSGVRS
jgi:hypothetical protein